jgi:hypothetical protein
MIDNSIAVNAVTRITIVSGYFSGVIFMNLYNIFMNNTWIKYIPKHIGAIFLANSFRPFPRRNKQKTTRLSITVTGESSPVNFIRPPFGKSMKSSFSGINIVKHAKAINNSDKTVRLTLILL